MSGLGEAVQPLRTYYPGVGTQCGVDPATELMTGGPGAPASGIIAANSVEAGQVGLDLIQNIQVTLTPAEIIAMYTTGVQIIPPPGLGKSIVLHKALFRFNYTTPQFTGGGAVSLEYDSTGAAGGTLVTGTFASSVIKAAASSDTILTGINVTATQNKGIFISNDTANFATGSVSTLMVEAWYSVI